MSRCKFCGLNVTFHGLGKPPTDPDGKDHRETCPSWSRHTREAVRDMNHESRVAQFLAGQKKQAKRRGKRGAEARR